MRRAQCWLLLAVCVYLTTSTEGRRKAKRENYEVSAPSEEEANYDDDDYNDEVRILDFLWKRKSPVLFLEAGTHHCMVPPAQGGVEGSVTFILTCSFSCLVRDEVSRLNGSQGQESPHCP